MITAPPAVLRFSLKIQSAHVDSIPAIAALLESENLPANDLERHLANFLTLRWKTEVVGAVGLEFYGDDVLLRSLVVAPAYRGIGAARALLRDAVLLAKHHGAGRMYLLTTTAGPYFERFGFAPVERREVPEAVAHSPQFLKLCPASARCYVAAVAQISV